MTRLAALACTALLLALACAPAAAAPVPDFEREVRLMAREQPVGEFVAELFAKLGLPVMIDDSVGGTVNGDFAKPASEVFDDLARSFQITLYYDGAVVHVYPSNAVRRTLRRLEPGQSERLVRNARALGLPDARNTLQATDLGVVVTGTDRFVEQIDELGEAVAVAAPGPGPGPAAPSGATVADEGEVFEMFELRYAWADDVSLVIGGQELVVPGVASLLRRLVETGVPAAPGTRRRALPATRDGLRGRGLAAIGERPGYVADEADVVVVDPLDAPSGTLPGAPPSDAVPPSVRPGAIVADSRNNAILVRDRAERMPAYARLIASLDVEPAMLEIEATIIDLDTDLLRDLGIDWRSRDDDASVLFDSGLAGGSDFGPDVDTTGASFDPVDSLVRQAGGVVSLVLGDEARFLARIRALESQGAARIVSKPHVMTLANVEALLDTTSTFFVRVAGEEEVDLFDVSVGTTLRVTPHVFDDAGRRRIKLLVAIEDGAASDRTVDTIPVVERSSINTQALIDAGQSLLVGGLVREFDGSEVVKVPVLGSIPVLGRLFRSNSATSSRVERLFLISPRLVGRDADPRRLSAPILFGGERDIVSTAPRRLDAVRAGLVVRDAVEPVAEPLPPLGPDVDLRTDEAWVPRPSAPAASAASAARAREPSLRDRLLGLAPDAPPTAASAEPPAEPPVDPPVRAPAEPPAGAGWQAVRRPRPGAEPAPDARPAALAVTGDDGWVEVPAAATTASPTAPSATAPADDGWEVVR